MTNEQYIKMILCQHVWSIGRLRYVFTWHGDYSYLGCYDFVTGLEK